MKKNFQSGILMICLIAGILLSKMNPIMKLRKNFTESNSTLPQNFYNQPSSGRYASLQPYRRSSYRVNRR